MQWAAQRWWLGAFVAGLLHRDRLAEPRAAAQPAGEDALVLAADTALGAAMRADDKSAARRLLSLQFTYVDENGKIHERKEFLADLKGVAAALPSDVKVKIYGLASPWSPGTANRPSGKRFLSRHLGQAERRLARAGDAGRRARARRVTQPRPDRRVAGAKPYRMQESCQTIPYRVRSPAEQDIVTAFQAIEKATVAHDADEWAKHVADEFVLYRSGRAPLAKAGAHGHDQATENRATTAVTVSEIESMRLSVYGDGAAMIATHGTPESSRPPFRAAASGSKRNGQWQLAIERADG